MKQSKDLDITGPDEQFLALIDAVSSHLPAGWYRDPEAEAHMERLDLERTDPGYAFARDAREGDPPARLFLRRERGRLHVSNIVPCDVGQLSMGQYNAILDEFAETLRTHLPSDSQLDMRITSDEAAITIVVPSPVEVTDCRDPFDRPFLELALAARADALVTGDRDLQVLAEVFLVPILTPAAFRDRFRDPPIEFDTAGT